MSDAKQGIDLRDEVIEELRRWADEEWRLAVTLNLGAERRIWARIDRKLAEMRARLLDE